MFPKKIDFFGPFPYYKRVEACVLKSWHWWYVILSNKIRFLINKRQQCTYNPQNWLISDDSLMKMFLASPGKHCPITKLCQHSGYLKVSWKHCLCSTTALIEYIVHHGYIGLGPRSIEPLCQPQKLVQSWSLTHKEPITAIDPKLRNLGEISFILLQNSPSGVRNNFAN